jgi:hypothetical protein
VLTSIEAELTCLFASRLRGTEIQVDVGIDVGIGKEVVEERDVGICEERDVGIDVGIGEKGHGRLARIWTRTGFFCRSGNRSAILGNISRRDHIFEATPHLRTQLKSRRDGDLVYPRGAYGDTSGTIANRSHDFAQGIEGSEGNSYKKKGKSRWEEIYT